ncbi:MAG: UDP-N-acetylmuramate dehydrogenase [Oscillospiraceae bacterium]|nr:UDP-N-acetylmuramate dehydrogenase [Oscillospiraceae bacterium]
MNLSSIKSIRSICDDRGATFLENTRIAPYTSFKIGGKCNIVKVNRFELLRAVLKHCKNESVPFHVLGRGSNVLISDKGLDGVVLLIGGDFAGIDVDGEVIKCRSGAKLSDICKIALLRSLTGMEFAYGIPGTAGGALYMNAGAYGGEMSQVVESCSYLDDELTREPKKIAVADMDLSYRNSIFAKENLIITGVKIRLKYSDRAEIKKRMDEISAARREKQPLDFPSAGSTFKRPDGYFAAKLIEDCGLKGKTFGGAQVSDKHSGFVINRGDATFDDVVGLIDFIKEEVFKQTGVTLECEVKILNS